MDLEGNVYYWKVVAAEADCHLRRLGEGDDTKITNLGKLPTFLATRLTVLPEGRSLSWCSLNSPFPGYAMTEDQEVEINCSLIMQISEGQTRFSLRSLCSYTSWNVQSVGVSSTK